MNIEKHGIENEKEKTNKNSTYPCQKNSPRTVDYDFQKKAK